MKDILTSVVSVSDVSPGDGSGTQSTHVILIVHLRSGCDGHLVLICGEYIIVSHKQIFFENYSTFPFLSKVL